MLSTDEIPAEAGKRSKMEKKDFLLKRYEYQLKNYTDSNQAMIEFSKMALRGTMLLNGTAVIPIVYSKVEYLYPCAIFLVLERSFQLVQRPRHILPNG